jgi:hypothetical protein
MFMKLPADKTDVPVNAYFSPVIILLVLVLISQLSFAQTGTKDFGDVAAQWKKNPDKELKHELVVGKTYYSILPVIGFAPANGFLIGGAISFSRLFGQPPTNMSSGMLNFQVTSKKQFIVNARSKIYLSENKWFLQGDWRLLLFTQPTYGLGINNSEFNKTHIYINILDVTEDDTLAEPMKFKLIRFYEEVSRRIGKTNIFAGIGISIDQHFDIKDERLDTITGSQTYFVTNHYAYSVVNNFNPVQYGNTPLNFKRQFYRN